MTQDSGKSVKRPIYRRLPDSLSVLRNREYRLLWIGRTVSSAGNALTRLAFIFAVLKIDGDAGDVGIVIGVQTACQVVFTLLGGVWADRLQRQVVMLTSDLLRAVVQTVLGLLLVTGHAQVWHLVVGAAIFGASQAFFAPASTGLLPEVVPADQLQRANALLSFGESFLAVGGPLVSGLLIALIGPGPVFLIDAVTFLISAVALSLLRLPPRAMTKSGSFLADLRVGWVEVVSRPWYWTTLIVHAIWNAAIAAYFVLGPVIAERQLGGAATWGLLSACWAAGGVVGGVITLHAKPRLPIVSANLALATTVLPMLALIPPLPVWAIGVAAFISGIGLVYLGSVWSSTMQQLIPEQVRSRVDSFDWLISLVIEPLGFILVGPIAAVIGYHVTLGSAAAIIVIPCVLSTLLPAIRAVHRTPDGELVGPRTRRPGTVSEAVSE